MESTTRHTGLFDDHPDPKEELDDVDEVDDLPLEALLEENAEVLRVVQVDELICPRDGVTLDGVALLCQEVAASLHYGIIRRHNLARQVYPDY